MQYDLDSLEISCVFRQADTDFGETVEATVIASWAALGCLRPSPGRLHVAFPERPSSALNWAGFIDGTASRFGVQEDAVPVRILDETCLRPDLTGEFSFKFLESIRHTDRCGERKYFSWGDPNVSFPRSAAAITTLSAFERETACIPRFRVRFVVFRFLGVHT